MVKTKAVILIGGPSKGTRFRPLSFGVPKPLFPIANKPMVYHHIKSCVKQLPDLVEVILLGFFDPNLFAAFIEETQKELSISIRFIQEDKVLGTAGGLYKFRDIIRDGLEKDSTLFIFNCDVMAKFPLQKLEAFHVDHGNLCTILTKTLKEHDTKDYGCVVADTGTNEVLHYAEKPETFVSDLVNCGVYLFRMEIFDRIAIVAAAKPKETDFYSAYTHSKKECSDEDVVIQLEQDVFRFIAGNNSLYSYEYNGCWSSIKHPMDSLLVNEMLLSFDKPIVEEKNKLFVTGSVLIHPSAEIQSSSRIGGNVTIGKNVKIGAGCRIKNSIILEGVEIRDHACIINSIIGWNSTIGHWCRIEGTKGKITILGEGVKTKPEIIVRNSTVLPHKELSRSHNEAILL